MPGLRGFVVGEGLMAGLFATCFVVGLRSGESGGRFELTGAVDRCLFGTTVTDLFLEDIRKVASASAGVSFLAGGMARHQKKWLRE